MLQDLQSLSRQLMTHLAMSLAMPFVGNRLRVFTANRLIDVAWALRWLCKSCARRLLGTARRLVPEAERYFIRRF